MKKFLLIFLIFMVSLSLVLTLLQLLGIWSIGEVVGSFVQGHPWVEPYIMSKEDKEAFQEEIAFLSGEVKRLQEEKEQLENQARSLTDIINEKDRQLSRLEDLLREEQKQLIEREERIKNMARIYNQMSPEDAAAVLGGTEDDLIIELLFRWDDRFAARVLANLEQERAVRLTELLAQ